MTEKPIISKNMKDILEHQQQIKTWLSDVKRKIFETETIYLEETQLGNIVKGWEIDGKPPISRVRGQCDDKERLFSYSSYESWTENKQAQDSKLGEKKPIVSTSAVIGTTLSASQKSRKLKKRKSDAVDDWTNAGDY